MPEAVSQTKNQSIGDSAPSRQERLQPEEETGARRNLQSAQKTAKRAGQGMKAAGTGAQAAGTGMQAAGKGMQAAGKGLQTGGRGMMSAGSALSSTGAGAIAGVPLMAAGGATTAAGAGTQAAGKGTEMAGRGAKKAGKGMKKAGKGMTRAAKNNIRQTGQRPGMNTPGLQKGTTPTGKPSTPKLTPGQETPVARGLNVAQKQSMRQKIKQAKKTIGEVKEQANQLFQQGTAELLKQSWLNVISSYGLTLLYINFHFVAKYIGSIRLFCDFGEEWTSKMNKLSQAPGGGKAVQVAKAGLKYAEIIAILFIDFLLILIFLMVLIYHMLPIIIPIVIIGTVLKYVGII
jgi:hypothetical protein